MSTTAKVTYDDYAALPDDGKRYEVIDGELLLVPAPNRRHQYVAMNLTLLLGPFVRLKKLGEIYFAPFDVVLSNTNIVQPDLIFISTERAGVLNEKNARGVPDLVVEILSPSDPGVEPALHDLVATHFASRNEQLTTPLLPGLMLSLSDVFATV